MKIIELLTESASQFDPLLIEFWKSCSPEDLRYFFVQNNCYGASQSFMEFLEDKGIHTAEIVPIGRIRNGKKTQGWFHADVPDTTLDAFTKEEITAMKNQGLNPHKKADRVAYITNNNLEDEFKWIPHSWVELRGRILDPSGFYIDGKSGQFDRLVHNKSNLSKRYQYF